MNLSHMHIQIMTGLKQFFANFADKFWINFIMYNFSMIPQSLLWAKCTFTSITWKQDIRIFFMNYFNMPFLISAVTIMAWLCLLKPSIFESFPIIFLGFDGFPASKPWAAEFAHKMVHKMKCFMLQKFCSQGGHSFSIPAYLKTSNDLQDGQSGHKQPFLSTFKQDLLHHLSIRVKLSTLPIHFLFVQYLFPSNKSSNWYHKCLHFWQ